MKMKNLNLALLAALLLTGAVAQADYECTTSELSLTVDENHGTRIGNTALTLVSATEKTLLYGLIHEEGGVMLKKKVIDIYPHQGDTLTITSFPKSCGRGSCDVDADPVIMANLKIGETQTTFICDDINL